MVFKLRREVETPQRQNSGLGVMLLASAAMFFAVAGSAFILRARMASSCCVRSSPTVVVEAPVAHSPDPAPAMAAAPTAIENCGQAVYRNNPDGSVSVYFDLCPPDQAPVLDSTHVIELVQE